MGKDTGKKKIFGGMANPFGAVEKKESLEKGKRVQSIEISKIKAPKVHDRKDYSKEAIEELSRNIASTGELLQPIVLRELKNGELERLIGFRRIEAVKLLNWQEIPAIVLQDISDEHAILIMLSENLQRENLNIYDETIAILQYLAVSFGETEDEVKKHLWKLRNSASTEGNEEAELLERINQVTLKLGNITSGTLINRLSMLSFREEVLEALKKGEISYVAAKELHKLKDSDEVISLIASLIEGSISYKELKVLVSEKRKKILPTPKKGAVEVVSDADGTTFKMNKKLTNPQIKRIEHLLSEF
ncbi:MAG: Chromosome (Plasmid) partitioning protein ParB [uncultured Sulfurovum sp.]|uniref:Chromosome (Plasmid) partitioning protein ParB n=1 Tax=uncultured Sulfurovum sp. TaxID=269237 RepID=A0A6S6SLY8_9BACT|nr:MAG: Chromosome (Plasmid) partitioning protein ParB [uncultured Sulfurovum sp.]